MGVTTKEIMRKISIIFFVLSSRESKVDPPIGKNIGIKMKKSLLFDIRKAPLHFCNRAFCFDILFLNN